MQQAALQTDAITPGTIHQGLSPGQPLHWTISTAPGQSLTATATLSLPPGLDGSLAALHLDHSPSLAISLADPLGRSLECDAHRPGSTLPFTAATASQSSFSVSCRIGAEGDAPLTQAGGYQVTVAILGAPSQAKALSVPMTLTVTQAAGAAAPVASPTTKPSHRPGGSPSPAASAAGTASVAPSHTVPGTAHSAHATPATRHAHASGASAVRMFLPVLAAIAAAVGGGFGFVALRRWLASRRPRYVTPSPHDPGQSAESQALHRYLPLPQSQDPGEHSGSAKVHAGNPGSGSRSPS
ncbi:hypothetical protein BIV57_02040 [Mangrovactinospora gilvigrisea]|uniref:Uncharacterized protein n=1 Tax=Mangrovactinospora gilvigrisea TaxID=1428644 RepID=A0A1J7BKH0_9ACTN|nr:hypothetical protein BIV57_02040 [Mangrovactinospora gilvigrisea]